MLIIGLIVGLSVGVVTGMGLAVIIVRRHSGDNGDGAPGCAESKTGEIKMNYVVKDDNPDVGFTLAVGEVKDAEGNVIPDAEVDLTVESSDSSVVNVSYDPTTKRGTASFGNPGSAAVTVNAKSASGKLLATGGDNFTVTTGDPNSVASVGLTFEGLTPTENLTGSSAGSGAAIDLGSSSVQSSTAPAGSTTEASGNEASGNEASGNATSGAPDGNTGGVI